MAHLTNEALDDLALHAMDLLNTDDAARLEQHLSNGCRECSEQLAAFQRVVAAIYQAVPFRSPPPTLRKKLLREIIRRTQGTVT